ncbi:hypothetical protein AB0L13_23835 [Saccharopolyspora shandongensis]|uniref:hypothetical protein n=1 Tax=Saccharopolyspora shandongensis TaxID=418495 RepID=UPI0034262ADD
MNYQEPALPALIGDALQQRRFADAGLAATLRGPAVPIGHRIDQIVQRANFIVATEDHCIGESHRSTLAEPFRKLICWPGPVG